MSLLPAFFSKFPIILWNNIWFDFPLAIFSPPQYTVCESRTIIAWPKGKKIKTQGEKISYIFPQLDFCALFSVTIKIIGEKIWYYVPYCLPFFSKFRIILRNIVWFDFPLAIFSPRYTVCENRTIIAGGKNIIYFPRWIFVLFLARQLN